MTFFLYSFIWYQIIHQKYDPYIKGMHPTYEGRWEQFFLNIFDVQENGFQYSVLYPGFLSYTGNLAISDKTDTFSVIIWPSFCGETEYGAMIQNNKGVYQIMVDENLMANKKADRKVINQYRKPLTRLMLEAKKRWAL